jgi:hypothetical protein
MKRNNCCFVLLLVAILTAIGFQALPIRSTQLRAAQTEDFEDVAQLKFTGAIVSGTGIRGKGGFTVVSVEMTEARTRLSVSFAVKDEEQRKDFRVIAVDSDGNRTEASEESKAAAGGNGIVVVTLVSAFELGRHKIDSLLIQQRPK